MSRRRTHRRGASISARSRNCSPAPVWGRRSATGREIPFAAVHVIVTGPINRFEDLREGMTIGFDVGWTSKGLRVTVLHTGD